LLPPVTSQRPSGLNATAGALSPWTFRASRIS